jgi:Tol biopolymer transport system component
VTPDRWRRVTGIFHAALARDAAARDVFLREACRSDASLRADVDILLAAHVEAGSFGSEPLAPDGAPRLSTGTRLGGYQIEELLGSGGMGEVYRARDLELARHVAIKIVSGAWLADPNRRARLDQEARLLAALNHPHVASIHGVVEADGLRGLVLELVEGETLADRLNEGPLLLTEAVHVATQIADALDATHEKGIVHRDLKPANIKITPDGVVKVLDFGVAKVRQGEHAGPGAPEWSTTGGRSRDGLIVGTAAYMSPEQARGRAVDRRSDIWAFGCVLYEMLTGRRAFDGETPTDVLAAIIHRDPEWGALPATVPSAVRHLLERCLEKDPKRRLRDIGDAKAELEETAKQGRPGKADPRGAWRLVAATLLVAAIAIVAWPAIRFRIGGAVPNPSLSSLTTYPGTERTPSLNPDGTQVAFTWDGAHGDNFDIYVKPVGPGDPVQLTKHPAPEGFPAWSPVDASIAFTRLQEGLNRYGVYVIPALGGAERKVGDASAPRVSWLAHERSLVIARQSGVDEVPALYKLSIDTGALTQLTSPAAPRHDEAPAVAPNGEAVVFSRFLAEGGITGAGAGFMLLRLSRSGEPIGEPVAIPIDMRIRRVTPSWSADSREIIYSAGWNLNQSFLWRVAAAPGAAPERLTLAGEGAVEPAVSRDGRRLVFSRFSRKRASGRWSSTSRADERARPCAYSSPPNENSVRCSHRMERESRSNRTARALTKSGSVKVPGKAAGR